MLRGVRRFLVVAGLAVVVFATLRPSVLWSQDSDKLAVDLAGELRRTRSQLYSGRYADVFAKLVEIDARLAALQASDPGHKDLAKLVKEFADQKKTVEEKLNRTMTAKTNLTPPEARPAATAAPAASGSGGAAPAAASAAAGGSPAPAAAARPSTSATALPYDARYPMQQFKTQWSSFENKRESFDAADLEQRQSLLSRMDNNVQQLEENLKLAREAAAAKGVTSHPELDDAQKKLDAAKEALGRFRTGLAADTQAAGERAKVVGADAEGLKSESERLRDPVFNKAPGSVPYYNDPREVEALLAVIENFESRDLPALRKLLADFSAKYGSTRDQVNESTGDRDAGWAFEILSEGIKNVAKTRTAMADDLVAKYNQGLSSLSSTHDFYKVKAALDLKRYLDLALKFSPDNANARAARDSYQAKVDEALKSFYAAVDKRTWPDHASKAPSNASSLARTALKWFEDDIGWGQRDKNPEAKEDKEARRPLAVAVTGPWSVQATNILGAPIMYGLPVLLAVQVDSEKPLNLARVYNLTMRTRQAEGVKEAPPFDSITVGDSFYIRPSEVK